MIKYIFLFALFTSCQLAGISDPTPYIDKIEIKNDSLLFNIQDKIDNAFIKDITSGQLTNLENLIKELELENQTSKQNLYIYWISYAEYHASIAMMQHDDPKQSEKLIDLAIKRLDRMSNKNSEDYAMLAMAQGFGIQFKGMKAMFVSASIKKNIKRALDLEPNNLRAVYVAGSNDYYTPAKYGGGKKVDEYLLKAIEMEAQQTPNTYLPSWGKEESYEILIAYYIKKEDWDNAKAQFTKANKLFPNNYMINQMASKLVGK